MSPGQISALELTLGAFELTQDFFRAFAVLHSCFDRGRVLRSSSICWARAQHVELELNMVSSSSLHDFPAYFAILIKNCHLSLNDLQNTKTPKLTKKSENNTVKGLTKAN